MTPAEGKLPCAACEHCAQLCENMKVFGDPYAPELIRAAREIRESCRHAAPSDRRDAERYRWLRDKRITGAGLPSLGTYAGHGMVSWDANSATTDAAIDAAIERKT